MQALLNCPASRHDDNVEAGASPPAPIFRAYGSGAPKWLGLPIYICFFMLAVVGLAPQVLHPFPLRGISGFLLLMMDKYIFFLAAMAAYAIWRTVSWRLRSHFPDQLLVMADGAGIRLPSGELIPYAEIRRIDPHSRGTFTPNQWIQIGNGTSSRWKVDVNMTVDPPEQILAVLRQRALEGGAYLEPELPNGRRPTGSQLGYRQHLGWRG